ncbi:MAG: MFS transporter [Crocinitomicaceae bacterium]
MRQLTAYLKNNRYLIGFGFLLTFLSSFGQTFLISLYLPHIQKSFQLSDGGFSSMYAGATLLSAFTITWLGRYIDKVRLLRYVIFVMIGLVVGMAILSQAYYLPILFIGLYGLRLFGQGLLSHTAITSMARFFDEDRGKAISLANLGHPFGEAILPIIVVSIMYLVGWRYTLIITLSLVILAIPYTLYLLRKNTSISQLRKYIPAPFTKEEERESKPWKVMQSKAFWIIMPSSLLSASIGTGFLLFKLKLGLANGWSPTFIAVGFTAYAVGNAAANLIAGFLADRYSGRKMFPLYLLPAILGFTALTIYDHEWVYIALVGGIGLSNGFGGTVKNVALAEMYGTKIIGSVRSLFTTVMVFSTALGPLVFGLMLDNGYTFTDIALFAAILYALFSLNALRSIRFKREE